jgi:succinate dehydrogenase / fumarate reductase, cytochrome b subunit
VTENIESCFSRNHFAIRRIHSLLGIIPVGAFLVEHLLTNSLAFFGPAKFNEQVHWLHNMHYLIWLEILFIFLPLALHGVYGLVIAWQAKNNAQQYQYADNWRFVLQRWTGIFTFCFIIVHLCHFRFADWFGGTTYVGNANPFELTARGFHLVLPAALWYPIYFLGFITATYHFCNGLVTFCITWGISISVPSRKRISILAAGVGALLALWGLMSLYGLASSDAAAAPTPEIRSAPHTVQMDASNQRDS